MKVFAGDTNLLDKFIERFILQTQFRKEFFL